MRIAYIYNVIYKSRCLYVGSTWNFNTRVGTHLSVCYNPNSKDYNFNIYKFIRKHDVWEAFHFNIIDTIETDDSKEDGGLFERLTAEQYYIDMLEPTLNDRDAIISPEERRRKCAEARKNITQSNRDTKRFACESCGFVGYYKSNLDKHYNTKKHKQNIN